MNLATVYYYFGSKSGLMEAVLKRLTRQLRVLSEKVFESATLPVGKRIAAELLRLAEPLKTEVGNAVLYPAPTNTDIASRVATTRETVNRELREMMEAGIVEKHGRTLVIPNVEKLRRLVVEPAED